MDIRLVKVLAAAADAPPLPLRRCHCAAAFYTNRAEASTRIQEPNTFFCCRTYDADEQALDDLQLPPSPPPRPPPPPPEPQPHIPPPVQPHTTAVPMDAEPSIPEPGVTDSAAPVAAENPTAAAGGEKRTRKSLSSRIALNVLEGKLQHALDEIAVLKQQMMELQAKVVCIQSSSGSMSERSNVSTL